MGQYTLPAALISSCCLTPRTVSVPSSHLRNQFVQAPVQAALLQAVQACQLLQAAHWQVNIAQVQAGELGKRPVVAWAAHSQQQVQHSFHKWSGAFSKAISRRVRQQNEPKAQTGNTQFNCVQLHDLVTELQSMLFRPDWTLSTNGAHSCGLAAALPDHCQHCA